MMWKPGIALVAGGVTLVAAATLTTAAEAQERVRWKMQSAFPGNLPHTGVAATPGPRRSIRPR
jgi:hypothetical protein